MLADHARVSLSTVKRALTQLQERGHLNVINERPVGRRNSGAELFDEVIDDGEFRKIVQKATGLAADGNVPVLVAGWWPQRLNGFNTRG